MAGKPATNRVIEGFRNGKFEGMTYEQIACLMRVGIDAVAYGYRQSATHKLKLDENFVVVKTDPGTGMRSYYLQPLRFESRYAYARHMTQQRAKETINAIRNEWSGWDFGVMEV